MDEDISEAAVEEFETAFSYVPCKLWFKQLILKALHTKTAAASGGPSVLSCSAKPSSSQGSNGDIYIKTK